MKVAKDRVVSLTYRLKTEDGVLVDESPMSAPLEYLHGHGSLIPRLEKRWKTTPRATVYALSVKHGVSISTEQQVYRVLEHRQLITARPKSSYFVCQQHGLPEICWPAQQPVEISQ